MNNRVSFISAGNLGTEINDPAANLFGKNTLIIAKRGSGKSFLICGLIDKFKKMYDNLLIVSPTEHLNQLYTGKYNGKIKHSLDDVDLLAEILPYSNPLIILDDCLSTKSKKVEILRSITKFKNVTLICSIQFMMLEHESLSKFDYVMMGCEDYISNLRRMYERVSTGYPDFNSYRQAIVSMNNYHFMLVNQKFKLNKINNQNNIPKLKTFVKKGDSIMIISNDENNNKKLVENIINKLEISNPVENIYIINETGINNYDDIDKVHIYNENVIKSILFKANEEHTEKHYVVIFDKLESSWFDYNQMSLREILFNGRHYGITLIVSMLQPLSLPPDLRLQFNRVITNNCWSDAVGKKIYDQYYGMFRDYKKFREYLNNTNDEHYIITTRSIEQHWSYAEITNDKFIKHYTGDLAIIKNVPFVDNIHNDDTNDTVERLAKLKKIKKLKKMLIGECYLFSAEFPDDSKDVGEIIKYSKDIDVLIDKIDHNYAD